MPHISDARILIIATDGFELTELFEPRRILLEAGAKVTLASPQRDPIEGEADGQPPRSIDPDLAIGDIDSKDYDALLLPGGVRNPDTLRMNEQVIYTIRKFVDAGKPVAAICHGPWLLVEADVVRGRAVTSWPSIRTDLRNAGATVLDMDVVVDGPIITSRKPADVEPFTRALIEAVQSAEAIAVMPSPQPA
jgi:protease I